LRAGAKGESWVKGHDDGLRFTDGFVPGTDPQALAEPLRVKILEPLALPGARGEALRCHAVRIKLEGLRQSRA
jgi:hypothetical protein